MDATTDAALLPDRPRVDHRRPIALVVGVVAAVLFVGLRFAVELSGSAPLPIDQWWDDAMADLANPVAVIVAWIPAIVGGTIGMIVIGVATTLVFLLRRRPWDALAVASSIALVVLIGAPLAAVIARARPADSLAETVATSFPSGHTAVATTIAVVLGLILRRGWVWAAGVVWVVAMMWSRTYLHAHWLSDVTAGLLEGIAVSTLVWALVEVWRVRRAQRLVATGE
ncbi:MULTISPECIES: phosphatase PAP2 family protein [unclassified Microbacterium]|uniref:phosphatase PAP2 family protein n=1 Tax=unclassified Microbacterium TaxID=2609290 RepID=UPI000892A0A2|nr:MULTISPECIES: phosphatase PAP2 family protein [unclassified Microbacterium]AOX45573.1 phospholipid phosphatase [Microbacterium sp. BH-3-3-3]MBD8220215.1 phosphatase PAP2 family protein [Microbacterium sp. CFBP 13617]